MSFDFTILKLRGAPVRIHAALLLLVPIAGIGASGGAAWAAGAAGMLLSIGIHAAGRGVGWHRRGIRARDWVLIPTGTLARPLGGLRLPGEELSACFGGGMASLLAGLVFTTAGRLAARDGAAEAGQALFAGARYSLWLALANLSPGFPFGGHRVWRAALSPWIGFPAAARRASDLGRATAAILLFAGLWQRAPWLLYWALFAGGCAEAERRAGQLGASAAGSSRVRPDEITVSPPPYERPARFSIARRVRRRLCEVFDDLFRRSMD